jgi:hypothetical protein
VVLKYGTAKIFEQNYSIYAKGLLAASGFIFSMFDFQAIRWTSYFSNFFNFLLALILLFQMPGYYMSLTQDPEVNFFSFDTNIFTAIGTCFFAFSNHFSMVTIIKILKNDSIISKYKVLLSGGHQGSVPAIGIVRADQLLRLPVLRQGCAGVHRQSQKPSGQSRPPHESDPNRHILRDDRCHLRSHSKQQGHHPLVLRRRTASLSPRVTQIRSTLVPREQ